MHRIFAFCIFLMICFFRGHSNASHIHDGPVKPKASSKKVIRQLQIQTYEDNLFGYTWDNDDQAFVDVTVSLQARLYPFDYLLKLFSEPKRPNLHLNIAFTGRFGQYIGTRYSSPVIEKRLNPVLFLQYNFKQYQNTALQLAYGHESNGQALDDSTSFFETAALNHNTVNQTIDKVSRGWDYIGLSYVSDIFPEAMPHVVFETNVALKYFLDNGFLQGHKEEYRTWESSWDFMQYKRNDVSGIAASFTCFIDSFFVNKIRIGYETGIAKPFEAHSVKVSLGFNFGNMPVEFYYRYGYNGDLAQYGKLNQSLGIAYTLSSFSRPGDRRKASKTIAVL